MAGKKSTKLDVKDLRWTLDPKSLGFKTTDDLEPLVEIVGQDRGVEAFRFGMGVRKKGYNIFVTGYPGTGRRATVKKLLKELTHNNTVPDDLCYVSNFKHSEQPVLLRFKAGEGARFKTMVGEFLEGVKREVPQLFESEEYISRKNSIAEAHEKKVLEFYNAMEEKVKGTGLVVVRMQMGPFTRPDVVPLIDGSPKRLLELEEMVEKGRFPRDEFERLSEKRAELKEELDNIVVEVRKLQKEVVKKQEEVDKKMFLALARDIAKPLYDTFHGAKVRRHLDALLDDMVENLENIMQLGQKPQGPMAFLGAPSPDAVLGNYQVNLLVDNAEQDGPPVIFEDYPTYRNLFGSVERIMDRFGGWRTDFTKIKAGNFVKANGGYLVINLMDAIMEPGVWQTLKRSLKTEMIEIETYDPYYFISATGLKPEPIEMQVKVVVLGDPYLYNLLLRYDQDVPKIFKVRADYSHSMDRDDTSVHQVARFVRGEVDRHKLAAFDASAVAAIAEHAVRMAGRKEKITTAFPLISDLLNEADYFASLEESATVSAAHVQKALDARIYRSNQVEERIQEMIDRGSLFVDTDGEKVGQVNGLAVYSMGDYAFGKPSRITAVTSMGKEGIINIEREADLSGPTHNKGMLILSGFLRERFAQDKPLSLVASIAFEQSYGGVDGDSASSTELYALLSSLSGLPLRQDVAVTGSVNQRGEVQPIGGVNEKVEGYYLCCKRAGLTGKQGVMIPRANVKDLMLREDVVRAVEDGTFNIWAVATVEEGIELLTGKSAGRSTKTGYTKGSVFDLVNTRFKELAEGLRDFAKPEKEDRKRTRKKSTRKK